MKDKTQQIQKFNDLQLKKFFLEVFNFRINLSKVVFPQQEGFLAYMAVPPQFRGKEDMVVETGTKKFGVGLYKYQNPIALNIKRELEQKRPSGLYVFAHYGGDEPDNEYLGKSYNDALAIKMIFANLLEYLLITLFHKWLNGEFMDIKGWTHTSSLWLAGNLVNCDYNPKEGGLKIDCDNRNGCNLNSGPRQLIL